VPRDKAVINRLTLVPTPMHELAAAVRFQAIKELPFPFDEAVVDYLVMQRNEKSLVTEVMLAAMRKETLDRLLETCRVAGLSVARIGLRPQANLVSVSRLAVAKDKRVLFVDVGPTMTEIDVMRSGLLTFSRSASVGVPRRPDEYVSEESRVSAKGEQSYLTLVDAEESAAVDELLVETTRTLQAYRATEPNATIEQVIVAGGTGLESELVEAAEERFGLPIALFDPTEALGVSPTDAVKLRSFSAALGLAWGLDKEGRLDIDFLHPKRPIPPREGLHKRLRIAGIAAALLVVVSVAGLWRLYSSRAAELENVNADVESLRARLRDQFEIQNRVEEVGDWRHTAVESVLLDHVLTLTRHMIEPGKKSLARELSMNTRTATISMDLLADHWETVRAFQERLNALEVDGERVYDVRTGPWREGSNEIDPSFKGETDVTIEVRALREHYDNTKQREQARKDRIRKV
jgi:type IV pilus assembly protein PilM